MNTEIAKIVLSKVAGLSWMDKTAGLVRTANVHAKNAEGRSIIKKFPVACHVTDEQCNSGEKLYNDLIPDSRYRSVTYFEDGGINVLGGDTRFIQCQTTLKMVSWLNGKKLVYDGCTLSSVAVISLLKIFSGMINPFNEGNFVKIKIGAISEPVKGPEIFSRYSYDEAVSQYLLYPNDYFALNLRVDFSIAHACISDFELLEEKLC